MQHRVSDLPSEARHLVEQLLGRPVADEETISVRAVPVVKNAPPLARRREIARQMDDYFARIDQRMEGVDERELDGAIEEAIREVRKSRATSMK